MSVADIETKRAERKAALEAKRLEQYEQDLAKLDELEVEHGDGAVAAVDTPAYEPGLPTMVVVRAPKGIEYKRFRDRLMKAKGTGQGALDAQDELADLTVVYPDRETYRRMRDRFAGIHVTAANTAAKLADGKAAEEGKS